ncbi:lysylphosphatidylglycerol synthase transmembrane domain-containing protein [Actinoplanes rectilineatus]|uniref:lysylphosphatidylglycerol synthase transmembrane domain-containing protein n=1 Tax=Actinoplanes rectilineatus TaxID=113571 RepID=UPI0005F2906E|nr:YbhN family protein [Actinoplanes rectilineatus]
MTTPPALSREHPLPAQDGAPWWRRGSTLACLVAVILGVELFLGWPALTQALHYLRTPDKGWVAAAVAAEIASMGTYARMQRALLHGAGTKVSIRRHAAMAYASHSLSVTLPGGPVFSTTFNFRQMRRYGASPAEASWCIALSSVLSTGALILVGAAGGLLARNTTDWQTLVGYGLIAIAITAAVRVLAKHPQWLEGPVRRLLGSVNKVRHRPPEHGADRLFGFVGQLRAVRIHPVRFAVASLLAMANWLLDALCLWMCCVAVGADRISPIPLLIAYCAGMAAASVPIVPGGLGVIDAALVLGLVAAGLDSASAVAAVVLYRIISFGFIIGLGWLVWLILRRRARTSAAT